MSISIVLADDHRIVLEGLAALLAREPDLTVVGTAQDGLAAVKLARELRPQVVVTDLSMPGLNGIEAIGRILAAQPAAKVLCLSVHDESRLVRAALEAGAAGYLLKDCSWEELVRAVRTVMLDQVYLSPAILGVVVEDFRSRGAMSSSLSQLTAREREVVQLLAEGHSTLEIAQRLHVSVKTVATHREHVMQKLGIRSIAELTRYAIREGVSSLDVNTRHGHGARGED